eukprot:GAFH01001168.1.p1 GENE.GAFH01001168.1~~GAFH01001168.1.p1  ORF type:complete len:367 (-),score=45.68 GAFH01001168.1:359-1459(-)
MDLRLENILLDESFQLKLSSYGDGISLGHSAGDRAYRSTEYLAPEQLPDKAPTNESNVYAAGVCLSYLAYGRIPPWDTAAIQDPASIQNLLYQMLQPDPAQRISVDRLAAHPWMAFCDSVTIEVDVKRTMLVRLASRSQAKLEAGRMTFALPPAPAPALPPEPRPEEPPKMVMMGPSDHPEFQPLPEIITQPMTCLVLKDDIVMQTELTRFFYGLAARDGATPPTPLLVPIKTQAKWGFFKVTLECHQGAIPCPPVPLVVPPPATATDTTPPSAATATNPAPSSMAPGFDPEAVHPAPTAAPGPAAPIPPRRLKVIVQLNRHPVGVVLRIQRVRGDAGCYEELVARLRAHFLPVLATSPPTAHVRV